MLKILIKFSDNYSKHLEVYGNVTNINQMITSESFKTKIKITGNTLLMVIQNMFK